MIPPAMLYGNIIEGTDDPDDDLAMDGSIPRPPGGKKRSICLRFWGIIVFLFALQFAATAIYDAATGLYTAIVGEGAVLLLGPLGQVIANLIYPAGAAAGYAPPAPGSDPYAALKALYTSPRYYVSLAVGLLVTFFYVGVIYISRKRIRAIGNLGAFTCCDCLSAWCCFTCALCQDARATQIIVRTGAARVPVARLV